MQNISDHYGKHAATDNYLMAQDFNKFSKDKLIDLLRRQVTENQILYNENRRLREIARLGGDSLRFAQKQAEALAEHFTSNAAVVRAITPVVGPLLEQLTKMVNTPIEG